jgi:hypothetical protein
VVKGEWMSWRHTDQRCLSTKEARMDRYGRVHGFTSAYTIYATYGHLLQYVYPRTICST